MAFNLIDEPWIPVAADDQVREYSTREVLLRSQDLERLAPEVPTMVPAILRQLLLPIVLDVFDTPTDESAWAQRWTQGGFDPDRLEPYLDEHSERFDLFHPEQPFAQVAGLSTPKGDHKPSSLLIPTVASGNNVPLFSARTEANPPELGPAEAARWLLHVQCWDAAGIKSGAVGDPQARGGRAYGNPPGPLGQLGVVLPTGESLFETLMLNLPIKPSGLRPDDLPSWRRPPATATWEDRSATGLRDLFTWQSRRIRLIPTEQDGQLVVREVIVAAGDRLLSIPGEEPHTLWRILRKPRHDDPPRRPLRHQPGREAWRGLDALLAVPSVRDQTAISEGDPPETSTLLKQVADLQGSRHLNETYGLGVEISSIEYGNMQAVVEHLVSDSLPLPVTALRSGEARNLLEEVAAAARDLEVAVNQLDADLRRAAGGDPTPWNRGQRPGTFVIHQLDPIVRRLLAGLQQEPGRYDEARAAWIISAHKVVRRVAARLLSSVPPSAFLGRSTADGRHSWRTASAELAFRAKVAELLPVAEAKQELIPIQDTEVAV